MIQKKEKLADVQAANQTEKMCEPGIFGGRQGQHPHPLIVTSNKLLRQPFWHKRQSSHSAMWLPSWEEDYYTPGLFFWKPLGYPVYSPVTNYSWLLEMSLEEPKSEFYLTEQFK